jgi:nicotinic acid phosphoribosyltransferase
MRNPNLRFYLLFCEKEAALELLEVFPYAGEFLDIWIQRAYPVSKCTREEIACLPEFTRKQERFLDSLFRPWEEEPIGSWYAEKKEIK